MASVNLADYVTYGSGVSTDVRKANRNGYKTAYDLANKLGTTLYQYAGVVEIEIDETGDSDGGKKPFWIGVRLDGDVNIVGEGIDRTRIKFFPDTVPFNAYAFYQDSGRHNRISDCTITGPKTGSLQPEFRGIKHQGVPDADAITDETLTLTRVKIDGKFTSAVESNEGDLICTMEGCDISAYEKAVGYHVNWDTHKQLIVRNCYFHDTGLSYDDAALIYVSPGVAIDISHSRFASSQRFGVYINTKVNVAGVPLYSRITHNVFEDSLVKAIQVSRNNRPLIQGNLIRTKLAGIEFVSSYVGAEVCDNTFVQTNDAETSWQSIGGGDWGSGALVKVHGNTFDASVGKRVGLVKVIHMSGTGVIWDIADNVFRLNRQDLAGILGSTDDLLAFVTGNKFTGKVCDACMQFDGGTIYAKGNIIEVQKGRAFSLKEKLVKAYIDNNDVTSPDMMALYVYLFAGSEGIIRGGGNNFLSDQAQVPGTVAYQMITPKAGVSPIIVKSAAKTFLPMSYDTVHISGDITIDNFFYGHPDATRLFCGEVRIIFDDEGATTTASGNIEPATTDKRVVGRVYRFLLDSRRDKWRECDSG